MSRNIAGIPAMWVGMRKNAGGQNRYAHNGLITVQHVNMIAGTLYLKGFLILGLDSLSFKLETK